MKALRVILTILLITNYQSLITTYAQIAINTDGATPDASAMLEITSTDKGILIPRMDSTSRNNISNPAEGLMVYDSTTASFWYYANATWNNIKQVLIADADNDTKIQVEESSNEDIIRFDMNGTEFMRLDSGRIEIVNTGNSIFIGDGAGANDDYSDNRNVFIGESAGYSNTTGYRNIFTGYKSGYSNMTGDRNIFTGYLSGYSNTTGNDNVFTGYDSGYSNTTGSYNIFTGYYAGFYNTTGIYNIFTGYASGFSNTTGSENIFLGYQTGFSNTEGNNNIFLGYQAGYSNTEGINNTFLGYQAGYLNTTGEKNIFLGYRAGRNETDSNKLYIANSGTSTPLIYGEFDNDFLEFNGDVNVTGVLSSNSSGVLSGNFAIGTTSAGSESDFQNGSNATDDGFLTTPWIYTNAIEATGERGSGSTAITVGDDGNFGNSDEIHLVTNGISSLMVDGNQCVGIGTTTPTKGLLEVSGSASAVSSYTYFNYNSSGTGSSTTNTPTYSIYANGKIAASNFHAHSDERIKDIQGVSDSKEDLKTIMNIEITNYKLKDKIANGDASVKKVIAQQVKRVYPQAVTNNTIETVPDIYQTATINKEGWICFSNVDFRLSNSELKTGDKVQIIFEDKKELLEVLEVKENTFRVQPIANHQSPIFIYGRQVTDFHTVDYEAISMLNVSATQQLVKEVERLNLLVQQTRLENQQLKKSNQQLQTQVKKIEALEAAIQELQAASKHQ